MASSSDLESRAKEAFIDDHFELAVDLYSQAISLDPNQAELFADRAQTNIKLQNFTGAVADASRAIELDPSMAKAYLRKGIACVKLEEYQTAKAALETGASLASGDSRFINLVKECDERIAEEAGELLPEQSVDKASTDNDTPGHPILDKTAETSETVNNLSDQVTAMPLPKPKYRY